MDSLTQENKALFNRHIAKTLTPLEEIMNIPDLAKKQIKNGLFNLALDIQNERNQIIKDDIDGNR